MLASSANNFCPLIYLPRQYNKPTVPVYISTHEGQTKVHLLLSAPYSSLRVGILAPSPIPILGESNPGHPRGTPPPGMWVCTGTATARGFLPATFAKSPRTPSHPFAGVGTAGVLFGKRSGRARPSGCCAPWMQNASPKKRLLQSAARLGFQN